MGKEPSLNKVAPPPLISPPNPKPSSKRSTSSRLHPSPKCLLFPHLRSPSYLPLAFYPVPSPHLLLLTLLIIFLCAISPSFHPSIYSYFPISHLPWTDYAFTFNLLGRESRLIAWTGLSQHKVLIAQVPALHCTSCHYKAF